MCLTSNDCVPTAISKLILSYGILCRKIAVYRMFLKCFRTTNDSTVNWLQYRIFHRILTATYYLKKIKITTSECCTFCNDMS